MARKLLSCVGRGVLIQAVAQAILVYVMSCFKLPNSFVHELNMLMARFWWGNEIDRKRIHWINWENLCKSKLDGGLGFHDFEAFNLAFLAKQGWHFMHNKDTLCYQVFKARYFPHEGFLDAKVGHNPSFVWHSLLDGRRVLLEGTRWNVGDGYSISIMEHRWLSKPPYHPISIQPGVLAMNVVGELIDQDSRQWNTALVNSLFNQNDAVDILNIPLGFRPRDDLLCWVESVLGRFTVKSVYFVAQRIMGHEDDAAQLRNPSWKLLWTAIVAPKVKYFGWRLVNHILPVKRLL